MDPLPNLPAMSTAPREPGARRSLRARFASGPVGRRVAIVDVRLYRVLRQDLQVPRVEAAIRRFSNTGEHAALWHGIGVAGTVLGPRRHRSTWRRGMGAVLVTQVLNTALKGLVRRRRPRLEGLPALVAVPTQLSFPSAHSSTSFAAARVYSQVLPARPLYAVAAAMALSRVYLGVHYPSDIAVGAMIGTLVGSRAR